MHSHTPPLIVKNLPFMDTFIIYPPRDVTHWTYSTLKFICTKKSASLPPPESPEEMGAKSRQTPEKQAQNRHRQISVNRKIAWEIT